MGLVKQTRPVKQIRMKFALLVSAFAAEERRGLRKIVSWGRGLRAGFDNFFCYFNCDLGLGFCCVVGGAGGALGLGQSGLGLVDVDDVEAVRLLGEDLNGSVLVDCHGSGGDEELLNFTAVLV